MILKAQKILDFWFGTLADKNYFPQDKATMWFGNGADYDEVIRAEFLSLHNQACNDQLNDWQYSPKTMLALIILLDQFSRHIYRNNANTFAQDEKTVCLVKEGIREGLDKNLYFVERQFFYMPLMHAENLDTQELGIRMFAKLRDDVPEELKEMYTKTLSFAEGHYYVISKFGRFPELNEMLSRESNEQEIEFLSSGKYRFL